MIIRPNIPRYRTRRHYALMGALLVAGSKVRVGFEIRPSGGRLSYLSDISEILGDIEGCLYNTGQFQEVNVSFNDGGFFARSYLQVDATTVLDFAQTEDFGGLVAQQIGLCAPDVEITRRDPVAVDYIPPAAVNQQGVQQPQSTGPGVICPPGYVYTGGLFSACSPAPGSQGAAQPGRCDGAPTITDYLACQSGITSGATKTILLSAGLGLGALLIITLTRRG